MENVPTLITNIERINLTLAVVKFYIILPSTFQLYHIVIPLARLLRWSAVGAFDFNVENF